MNRFAGVGVINLVVIISLTILVIVGGKVIFTKHQVPGLSEIFQAV